MVKGLGISPDVMLCDEKPLKLRESFAHIQVEADGGLREKGVNRFEMYFGGGMMRLLMTWMRKGLRKRKVSRMTPEVLTYIVGCTMRTAVF
jgi:hypothetical protein